jgi:small subunit ribosomal protein S11
MAEEKVKKTESKEKKAVVEKGGKAAESKTSDEKKSPRKPLKSKKGKTKRRTVQDGKAYIQATFNNTMITITDVNGEVLAWSSAGANGFKGAKKATPYAAQVSAENAATKAKVFGLEQVHVYVKGVGSGREQAIRGLQAGGIDIQSITDLTPVAHNGCRPRKSRRV